MPFYEFRCHCGATAQERRGYDAMNEPGPACASGHGPTERIFSPTSNLFVPQSFQHTWSDFHDETERELARTYPDAEPANRALSRPSGFAKKEKAKKEARESAIREAIALTDAKYSAMGISTDA